MDPLISQEHLTLPFQEKLFQNPHAFLLSTLRRVQSAYTGGLLPTQLYEKWMAANGGNYQVENSQPAVALWDDFTKYPPRLPTKLDTPPELKSRAYTLKRCSKHGDYYISINWDRVKSRKDVKGLNEVWTYSSDADKNKTVLDAASVLWHAKRLQLTKPIDAMLGVLIPIRGTCRSLSDIYIYNKK